MVLRLTHLPHPPVGGVVLLEVRGTHSREGHTLLGEAASNISVIAFC